MKAIRVSLAAAMLALFLPPMAGDAFAADPTTSCIPADQCCKICDAGKACGNSCISRKFNCHKGRGCACNAENVCE